jgi:hypothetical protein
VRYSRDERKARHNGKNIRDHHRDDHRNLYLGVEVGAFVAVASPPDSPNHP